MDFSGLSDFVGSSTNSALNFVSQILPDSPFYLLSDSDLFPSISSYLPTLNFFIPIDFMVDLTFSWVCACILYFGVSVMLRWYKAIQ